MENRHESVVGKVVAFVVAAIENQPAEGREFQTPRAALDSQLRGWYFVKLELPDGKFAYEPGLHNELRAGNELDARLCTQCQKRTWSRRTRSNAIEILCLDCSEQKLLEGDDPTDYGFDWSEHESKCDGCSFCNPAAFREEE